MKKISRKLALTKETVRSLSDSELDRAGGGGAVIAASLAGNNCSRSVYLPCIKPRPSLEF